MNAGLYPKLALLGIRKNRRLYVPFMLSAIGIGTMFFILMSIAESEAVQHMRGGNTLYVILGLGKYVIAVFAAIFLYYTHSFLIRRRSREFGLYNVLGMDRRSIARVLAWETGIVLFITLSVSLALGIAFFKLFELVLVNMVYGAVDYEFAVSSEAVIWLIGLFVGIFAVLFARGVLKVRFSGALSLLLSENEGEKPPRANGLVACLGLLILGSAYFIAVRIQDPISAMLMFFVAVIMVIVGTYLLFISGSVTLCRALQKNKRYYYRKNHFVSVSGMAYRMKRNGAGLASICILCTMVLVMISSSGSLYINMDDVVHRACPNDIIISVGIQRLSDLSDGKEAEIKSAFDSVLNEENVRPETREEYAYVSFTGTLSENQFEPDGYEYAYFGRTDAYGKLCDFTVFCLSDYNALTGKNETLNPGEAFIFFEGGEYPLETLKIGDIEFRIAGNIPKFVSDGFYNYTSLPSVFLVVSEFSQLAPFGESDELPIPDMRSYHAYDVDLDDEEALKLYDRLTDCVGEIPLIQSYNGYSYYSRALAIDRAETVAAYGGLFFIAIILSMVFLFAAAMILYYKQVSEGYEDCARFDIMRRVGMTKQEIRKSVNSQVLTVFLSPLIAAGVHLAFAFPMIVKMLAVFEFYQVSLALWMTVGSFLLFSLLYAAIYKITAGAYYKIVSGAGED